MDKQHNVELARMPQLGAGCSALPRTHDIFRDLESILNFFKTWLKLDIPTLATAIVVSANLSAGSFGLTRLQTLGCRIYEYFTAFFSSSISIKGGDILSREVLNWLGANVFEKRNMRTFAAQTGATQSGAFQAGQRHSISPISEEEYKNKTMAEDSNKAPVVYLPTFETTWFFHKRNFFTVRRVPKIDEVPFLGRRGQGPAAVGSDELVVTCLGRSITPIKQFLEKCREFSAKQKEAYVAVHTSKRSENHGRGMSWDTTSLKPVRRLETVHFDEEVKAGLLRDITEYLDPKTRQFYTSRCIPYRRGYLLHGPPGSGKTSLALALAGRFGLDLYLLQMPSIKGDDHLESLFSALPGNCVILLEDIDAAIGVARRLDVDIGGGPQPMQQNFDGQNLSTRCTLSGLLNVLDGVDSQEGRIVIMTSNAVHQLDQALTRPGRIDRRILLSYIKRESAKLMFLRMFRQDESQESSTELIKNAQLQEFASKFSSGIPEDTLTPAKVQEYLLGHRNSPEQAVAEVAKWVSEELETTKITRQHTENHEGMIRKEMEEMREMSMLMGGRQPVTNAGQPMHIHLSTPQVNLQISSLSDESVVVTSPTSLKKALAKETTTESEQSVGFAANDKSVASLEPDDAATTTKDDAQLESTVIK